MFTSPATLTYTDVYLALDGSFMERRVVPVVSSVGVGPLTQQQGHHLKTTHRTFSLSNLHPALTREKDAQELIYFRCFFHNVKFRLPHLHRTAATHYTFGSSAQITP